MSRQCRDPVASKSSKSLSQSASRSASESAGQSTDTVKSSCQGKDRRKQNRAESGLAGRRVQPISTKQREPGTETETDGGRSHYYSCARTQQMVGNHTESRAVVRGGENVKLL